MKSVDIVGKKFGRYVAIKKVGKHIYPSGASDELWLCRCECGIEKTVIKHHLISGKIKSCGCLQRDHRGDIRRTHGASHKERLHGIWLGMKNRCNNPKIDRHSSYYDKGIKVCEEWERSYEKFRDWSWQNGYKEEFDDNGRCLYSIDRIDVNGDYSPENCRYVNACVQANNRTSNRILEHNGVSKTVAEWGREYNITGDTICARIDKLGWSIDRAITQPVRRQKNNAIK